jgi:hypothetical protein
VPRAIESFVTEVNGEEHFVHRGDVLPPGFAISAGFAVPQTCPDSTARRVSYGSLAFPCRSGQREPTGEEDGVSEEWDLGKFYRLKGTIEQAATSAGPADARHAREPFRRLYSRFRDEARTAVPSTLLEEFDRLFPEHNGPSSGYMEAFHEARALMLAMVGWFDGIIQDTLAGAEIGAYAAARVKAERAVGFGVQA